MPAPQAPPDPEPALLDAIFENAPVGLGFWDRDLRYRRINEALATINGIPGAEHLGRTPTELLGALGREAEASLRAVLESGIPVLDLEASGETPAAPGERRHWLVSYYPVLDLAGTTNGVAAAVVEVTDRHRAEEERLRLLKEALTARAQAEAALLRAEDAQRTAEVARARTEFLAEAGRRMAESMDFSATLQEVAEIAVPAIADWCTIALAQPNGELRVVAMAHPDRRRTGPAQHRADRYRARVDDRSGSGYVVRTGETELIAEVSDEMLVAVAHDAEHLGELRELGLTASLVVPLRTPLGVLGALSLAMAESGRSFDADDASLAVALASRAALHIRNAQLYTERSHIARTLQASLLPRALPDVPGMEVAARYLAAGDQNDVGGDFYDVFPTEDGAWTVLIGDVTGKGAEAAAVTSLARHTLRTAALRDDSPAGNLRLLNRAMLADSPSGRFCTVVYARLRPSPGSTLVTLASGGHPPPLVLRAAGGLETVDARGTLVGGVPEPEFSEAVVRLGPGDLLLLYTDGVTELRTADPDDGERVLRETLAGCVGRSAEEVVAEVQRAAVDTQAGPPRDDMALVALRVRPADAHPAEMNRPQKR